MPNVNAHDERKSRWEALCLQPQNNHVPVVSPTPTTLIQRTKPFRQLSATQRDADVRAQKAMLQTTT